jgi:hypothetical protein
LSGQFEAVAANEEPREVCRVAGARAVVLARRQLPDFERVGVAKGVYCAADIKRSGPRIDKNSEES